MNRKLRYATLSADLLWMCGAFVFAHLLCHGTSIGRTGSVTWLVHMVAIVAAILVWSVLFFSKKLEGSSRGWHLPSIAAQVTVGVCYLMAALLATAVVTRIDAPPAELLYLGGLLPFGFIGIRCSAWALVSLPADPTKKRKVVILGAGRIARELAHKIAAHPEIGMDVVGVLFPSNAEPITQLATAPPPISLRSLNVLDLLQEQHVLELIIAEPVPSGPETEKLLSHCRDVGIRIHIVPQHYELYLSKAELQEIDGVPLLSLQERKPPALGVHIKRAMDIAGSLLLLALSAPLLALASAALYASKGLAFRKELRCGKNGTPFWMYRLNIDRDAPLHGYAQILAWFSLTELPQLWNVLKGEMSLVGPRPEPLERVKHYSVWQRQRLTVTPGLTGLAQVRGLREEHSSEEKARFDLQYIGEWSLFVDFSLLLQTAWALFVRLVKPDHSQRTVDVRSRLSRDFGPGRMMHVDRAQSGAD
jgi:lipopolysaccharide/colanic/teichoic acid biosynthesis glycosyltransferase